MPECLSCKNEAGIAVLPILPVFAGAPLWEEEYCYTHFAIWGGNGELDLPTARVIEGE